MRHVNIPVFIPHLGCPHKCVFCDQHAISGAGAFVPDDADGTIKTALATVSPDDDVEIAFFGGSFTGIDRGLMIRLLDLAEGYVMRGEVSRIRCSTRPDYIDEEIADNLSRYTMGTVELGIQSVSERVLSLSERGHGRESSAHSCRILREHGINVGGQMMIGLPGATPEDEEECARFIADAGCCEARVYPTVVFKNTALCDMTRRGEYTPLSLEEAVERSARVLEIFDGAGVRVLRVGLCDSENLHGGEYEAGPNHPAIGELSSSRVFLKKILSALDKSDAAGRRVTVYVPRGAVSKAVGQRGANRDMLCRLLSPKIITFREDGGLSGFSVRAEAE